VPLILGTGGNQIQKVVKYNEWAAEDGADGVLVVTPYYNKSSQRGLVETFSYIAENSKLPVILYNVPSRTGVNLLPKTAAEIVKRNKNVVSVKEASGNISQIAELISLLPPSVSVVSGNDDQTLPIMALGGTGVVSVLSNICPEEMKKLTVLIQNLQMDEARTLNNRLNKIMNLMFVDVNPIPVKFAVSLLNLIDNRLRLPLIGISAENQVLIKEEMERLGWL